jgi:hypothetical protein
MAKKQPKKTTEPAKKEGIDDFPRASFLRRLAAMIYDALVVLAIGICAGLVILVIMTILHSNQVIGTGHEHVSDLLQTSLLYKTIVQVWVALWMLSFFLVVLVERWTNHWHARLAYSNV